MEWADGFWFKVLFVIGVTIAQGILWSWVFIKARQVAPGVKVFNFAEMLEWAKAEIDRFYGRQAERR